MHIILAVLTIAAASDLQPVLPRLAARFEQQTGHTIRAVFGSSGSFVAQLKNGAPFDVFLSADIDYPRQLQAAELAEPDTLSVYAIGSLVLWTRERSGVDVQRGLDILLSDRVRRIAIANPDHAPYGRAAMAVLRNSRLFERVRAKLVFGENVSQAAQFVQSGNADVGIIPLSLARSPAVASLGSYVAISPSLHPPIEQAAIILRSSHEKLAARAFLAFLKQDDAAKILADAGESSPSPSSR